MSGVEHLAIFLFLLRVLCMLECRGRRFDVNDKYPVDLANVSMPLEPRQWPR